MHRGLLVVVVAVLMTACDGVTGKKRLLPEPESNGAKLMEEFCSYCHAPPHPDMHIASEWKNIIVRMQDRRRDKALAQIDEESVALLLEYLEKHAKK